jgi:DNA-binding GntR family transcriptional regulator
MVNDWTTLDRAPAFLRVQVAEKLRHAITEGRFLGGDRLIERVLCEQFGVGRPLLREAIRQLEAEGLIIVVPHRGPIVRHLTLEDAADIIDCCMELEGLSARYFAMRGSDDDIVQFEEAVSALGKSLDTNDPAEVRRAKTKYYDAYHVGAHSDTVTSVLKLYQARMSQYWASSLRRPERKVEGFREIMQILSAIKRRDSDAAEKASQNYVRRSGRFMMVILAEVQGDSR